MKGKPTGMTNKSASNWVVLVVDDTPDNLSVVMTALQYYGAKVYTATNGEEGLALLKMIQPTVILLDIRMPKMDGWAMFKSVRNNPAISHIPIIAITAYAMESDKDEILSAGFDGYLSKPFDMFTFVDEIERFVTRASQKQQKSEDQSV